MKEVCVSVCECVKEVCDSVCECVKEVCDSVCECVKVSIYNVRDCISIISISAPHTTAATLFGFSQFTPFYGRFEYSVKSKVL